MGTPKSRWRWRCELLLKVSRLRSGRHLRAMQSAGLIRGICFRASQCMLLFVESVFRDLTSPRRASQALSYLLYCILLGFPALERPRELLFAWTTCCSAFSSWTAAARL